ncbi:hypothetical protein D9M71_543720 [compost metagenome]
MQATFLKPDFLLVGEVGGHCGVGDAQFFDIHFADDLADLPEDFLATDRPQAKAHIHQTQHVQVVEALDPVAILLELARRIDAANHRPHGATGDTGDVIAATFQFFDHPNVRIPASSARAQYQCHAFAHDGSRL